MCIRKFKKAGLLFIISFVGFSCKEVDVTPETVKDECITTKSSNYGAVIPSQYIVAYKVEKSSSTFRLAEKTESTLRRSSISLDNLVGAFEGEPGGFVAKLTEDQVETLQTDPEVSIIEQDRIISICACFTVVEPRLLTWNVKKIGYDNGEGKTAWVIDTGIDYTHPDLNVDQERSKSFISGQTTAEDENGHGTHVAGIIGAQNNRIGTLGIASGANLVSLKVLDNEGEGYLSNLIAAIGYVRQYAKAGDVVNISIGGDSPSEILDREIKNAALQGIYFAIAAGNDKSPAKNYSPSRANGKNIYTISAVDSVDNFASFSNYGNDVVDFAAPGVRILSSYTKGRYAYMSGTSMASPHVAGLLLINDGKLNSYRQAINDPDGVADPIVER